MKNSVFLWGHSDNTVKNNVLHDFRSKKIIPVLTFQDAHVFPYETGAPSIFQVAV